MRGAPAVLLLLVAAGCAEPQSGASGAQDGGAPAGSPSADLGVPEVPLTWDGNIGHGACAETVVFGCYGAYLEEDAFVAVGGTAGRLVGNLTWDDPLVPDLHLFVVGVTSCPSCPYGWEPTSTLASAGGTSPLSIEAAGLSGDWGLLVEVPHTGPAMVQPGTAFRFEGALSGAVAG